MHSRPLQALRPKTKKIPFHGNNVRTLEWLAGSRYVAKCWHLTVLCCAASCQLAVETILAGRRHDASSVGVWIIHVYDFSASTNQFAEKAVHFAALNFIISRLHVCVSVRGSYKSKLCLYTSSVLTCMQALPVYVHA